MKTQIHLHPLKIFCLFLSLALVLISNSILGEVKAFADITWLDIFGEGSTLILSLLFAGFILHSRPRGKVTNMLSVGFICFSAAMLQDILDEIFVLSPSMLFDDAIESVIAPIGICILAYGLYLWSQEQQAINEQLRRRERFYREHSSIDYITGLYTAPYMEQQIKLELESQQAHNEATAIMLFDIDGFDSFNRQYGDAEGDRLLKQVADLIVMNIRRSDLACRYASDRFIVLLPSTTRSTAEVMATEISRSLHSLSFHTGNNTQAIHVEITHAVADQSDGISAQHIVNTANRTLEQRKREKKEQRQQLKVVA
jgi:diguanylate cyclase (GGDEF)-like protein